MSQTLVEKIVQRFAVGLPAGHEVRAGDFLYVRPLHCLTHDNTAAVIPKFHAIGATDIFYPRQPVFALDHAIQNRSAENLASYDRIERFAHEHGIDFHPAGRGIGHQVMLEEGYVLPGALVVASDSHANIYGALAALGTPVVRTDAAAIWATGRTWWQVPPVVRVTLHGTLPRGASGKDVILALIGEFCRDEALNCCVEFAGEGVASLSMDDRMAIANMTTEWGALAGVFPYDAVTRAYLEWRADVFHHHGDMNRRITRKLIDGIHNDPPAADADAVYVRELEFDLGHVRPLVAGPNDVRTVTPVDELERRGVRIDKAFLMSCVNGRIEDFRAAADVLRGRRIAPHVRLYVAAASAEIEHEAHERGYWRTLLDAGATALPPGCGACIGLGEGVLTDGEVGISATNRNFDGRMGSRKSAVYLASPAVVAASATAGRIAAPPTDVLLHESGVESDTGEVGMRAAEVACPRRSRRYAPPLAQTECLPHSSQSPHPERAVTELLPDFPRRIDGELLFLPADNLNTDGIYGKEYTYRQLAPQEMAAAAMRNYDPEFQRTAREGDILVGGANFGCGSSREQAATALKARGIRLLVAGSFSQTFSRNAFNNGYICIECPALADELRRAFAQRPERTIRTGWSAQVDFAASRVRCKLPSDGGRTRTFPFVPLGPAAQELIVAGGYEALLRRQLAAVAAV